MYHMYSLLFTKNKKKHKYYTFLLWKKYKLHLQQAEPTFNFNKFIKNEQKIGIM